MEQRYSRDGIIDALFATTDQDDYNVWVGVGMVLKENGFDVGVFDDWSRQFTKYVPGCCQEKWDKLDDCLPDYVLDTLKGALPLMDRKLRGFADPEGVLTGVETRSSSPVRILRDETYQSAVRGLFPCGEGAGYAGGIVSAAVDGIRIAEAVAVAE